MVNVLRILCPFVSFVTLASNRPGNSSRFLRKYNRGFVVVYILAGGFFAGFTHVAGTEAIKECRSKVRSI